MKRRDYLKGTGALCGVAGLAGCGLFGGGGGSDTPTEEENGNTGTIELDDLEGTDTPAESTTPAGNSVDVGEVKSNALTTYQQGVASVTAIDESADYDFRGEDLNNQATALQSASGQVSSADGSAVAEDLATYLSSVASALNTAEPKIETLGSVLTEVESSGIQATGVDRQSEIEDVTSTLDGVESTLEDANETRTDLSTAGGFLTDEEIQTLETGHQTLTDQISALTPVAEGLTDYIEGSSHYAAGDQDRAAAREAGENRNQKRLDEKITDAQDDYEQAETTLAEGRQALDSVEPSFGGQLSRRYSRVECRVGALEETSAKWQEFAQLIVDRAPRSDIEQKEMEAVQVLQQCASQ